MSIHSSTHPCIQPTIHSTIHSLIHPPLTTEQRQNNKQHRTIDKLSLREIKPRQGPHAKKSLREFKPRQRLSKTTTNKLQTHIQPAIPCTIHPPPDRPSTHPYIHPYMP